MSRYHPIAVWALVLGMGTWATRTVPAQERSAMLALLNRFAAGEYEQVRRVFAEIDDVKRARGTIEREAAAWTDADGPAAAPRRRLIAATFALEFADVRMQDEWTNLRSLVEWGCELVRAGPPTEAERLWQLASVALAQGARDREVLYTSPPPVRLPAFNHLSHAESRFPDETRLRFADAVMMEAVRNAGLPPQPGTSAPPFKPGTAYLRARFEAVDYLGTFATDPLVGGEATLRLGLVWLSLERVDEALRLFEIASRSDDAFAAYLAHVFGGQLQDRFGSPTAAAAQYRAALEVLPRAQSASLALATLLLADGRPDEAYGVAREALKPPMPRDPWRVYGLGSYYRLPDYLRQLHEVLRP